MNQRIRPRKLHPREIIIDAEVFDETNISDNYKYEKKQL